MNEDAELPDDIQKLVDESTKQFKNCTTTDLMKKLEPLEQYVIDEVSSPFDVDDAFNHDTNLGDQIHRIRELLCERFDTASAYIAEENYDQVERLEEKVEGMQVAIDRLKVHGHDTGTKTQGVTYPEKSGQ